MFGDYGTILTGDALTMLRTMPDQSVQCCVTSPPYWGLRNYGVDSQIGLEPTVEEHIVTLTAVFREVCRVLRDDGTLWVNYGDTYAHDGKRGGSTQRHSGVVGVAGSDRRVCRMNFGPSCSKAVSLRTSRAVYCRRTCGTLLRALRLGGIGKRQGGRA